MLSQELHFRLLEEVSHLVDLYLQLRNPSQLLLRPLNANALGLLGPQLLLELGLSSPALLELGLVGWPLQQCLVLSRQLLDSPF